MESLWFIFAAYILCQIRVPNRWSSAAPNSTVNICLFKTFSKTKKETTHVQHFQNRENAKKESDFYHMFKISFKSIWQCLKAGIQQIGNNSTNIKKHL